MPRSPIPQTTGYLPSLQHTVLPSVVRTISAQRLTNFEVSAHEPAELLCLLRSRAPLDHATVDFSWWLGFGRAELPPAGSHRRYQQGFLLLHDLYLHQAWPDAIELSVHRLAVTMIARLLRDRRSHGAYPTHRAEVDDL